MFDSKFFRLTDLGLIALSSVAVDSLAADAPRALHRDYTLNAEFVHDVGELQLHVTNWGLIGSMPGATTSYSDAPSAMWPAGSGVDHIYEAALWIGARLDGVTRVTTGRRGGTELRASATDPLDTIYVGAEGAPNGARYPDPMPDDDGDGAIDEDFAGISHQSFRAELRDDHPEILAAEADHVPLNLEVVQKSYAWAESLLDGVIGFEFTIRSSDDFPVDRVLSDVYVGFFVDPDIGPRGSSAVAADDMPFFLSGPVTASDFSEVPLQLAGVYDLDGDSGVSPGWFGIGLVDHPTDPSAANDYRFLVSVEPFRTFAKDDEITVRFVMVVGEGYDGVATAAADGRLAGLGQLFDRDGDPTTGDAQGREFRVPWLLSSGDVVSVDDPEVPDAPAVEGLRSQLLPSLPNPFNPATAIRFRLPAPGRIELSIHDAAGRTVRTVDLGRQDAGEGCWIWNGTDDCGRPVASGTYHVRMKGERGIDTERVVLVK